MAGWLVFEIVNNSSRFIILYQLFTMDVDPSDASMLSVSVRIRPIISIHKFNVKTLWALSDRE